MGVLILVAPDKFRGTATAATVAHALAEPLRKAGHAVVELPLADGGEGSLEAVGGPNREHEVTNAVGSPVTASWRLSRGTAIIEMARASGLEQLGGPDHNDPVNATTYGTGELITLAREAGAKEIIVTLGGSATTDGGWGALEAMQPLDRFNSIELRVAADVDTKFIDAARVFAPQKGATEAQCEFLENRLRHLRDIYESEYGVDVQAIPGGGAAGGLAGGLAAAGATVESGFELISELVDLDRHLDEVDAIITGEGFLDAQSFHGKVVGSLLDEAERRQLPFVAIVGDIDDPAPEDLKRMTSSISLVNTFGESRAFEEIEACLGEAALLALNAIAGLA